MKHLDVLKAPGSLFLFIQWFTSNHCTELHFPIVASSLWGGYSWEVSSHAVSHTVGAEQELLFAVGAVICGSALWRVKFSVSVPDLFGRWNLVFYRIASKRLASVEMVNDLCSKEARGLLKCVCPNCLKCSFLPYCAVTLELGLQPSCCPEVALWGAAVSQRE